MNSFVYSLTVYDGKLIAGGFFTSAGGKASAYVAAWTKGTATGVTGDPPGLPHEWRLSQNYPNPFNPTTTIWYTLAQPERVRLVVFNVLGRKVKSLEDGLRTAGEHTILWDGTDDRGRPVSSGVYLYRLGVGDEFESKRMLLLK